MIENDLKFYTNEKNLSPLPTEYVESRLALLPRTIFNITQALGNDALVAAKFDHKNRPKEYGKLLAQICSIPELERDLLEEIDLQTQLETREAINKKDLFMDILIIGTGPASVSFATKIRQLSPEAKIVMIDERNYRGGQFADNGYNYNLNSLRQGPKLGFAGELSEPNNLGDSVLVQVSDISNENYPPKAKLVASLKVNGFAVAKAIVNTKVLDIVVNNKDEKIPYSVKAFHKETGSEINLFPSLIVYAGGQGKPKFGVDILVPDTQEALAKKGDRIFVSETFSEHIHSLSAEDLLEKVKKGMAFIGGRDSTNVALGEIINKLSSILPISEIQKLKIDVYGTKYNNAEEFKKGIGTQRYDELIPYIGNLIQPHREKVKELFVGGEEKVGIKTASSVQTYSTISFMTGYHNSSFINMIKSSRKLKLRNLKGKGVMQGETIAQQVGNENIYIVGVAVQEKFEGKIPRFARSIRRHTPRILAFAENIAKQLKTKDCDLKKNFFDFFIGRRAYRNKLVNYIYAR